MARYIDADKLMELSQDVSTFDYVTKSFGCFSGVSDEDIAKIPTADVVEVPCRCENCKYYVAEYCARDIKGRTNMFYMQPTDFCSYGEKKN